MTDDTARYAVRLTWTDKRVQVRPCADRRTALDRAYIYSYDPGRDYTAEVVVSHDGEAWLPDNPLGW